MMSAAAAETAHGGEAASASLPQLDPTWWPSQLFWLALTFGVLYWLMAGKFLPTLGGAIEERRDRIADDLDQAAEFRRQAEDAEALGLRTEDSQGSDRKMCLAPFSHVFLHLFRFLFRPL